MKQAILVVDMLNDFVTGALKCDRGLAIVPKTAQLLDGARKGGVPVVFCNDAHIKGIDHELKLWGDHAIVGTKGAEVIPELKLCQTDYVVPKRRYSGFFHTDLDLLLKELGVDTVIMTGLHTHFRRRLLPGLQHCGGKGRNRLLHEGRLRIRFEVPERSLRSGNNHGGRIAERLGRKRLS